MLSRHLYDGVPVPVGNAGPAPIGHGRGLAPKPRSNRSRPSKDLDKLFRHHGAHNFISYEVGQRLSSSCMKECSAPGASVNSGLMTPTELKRFIGRQVMIAGLKYTFFLPFALH